jgi:hypothetical protein
MSDMSCEPMGKHRRAVDYEPALAGQCRKHAFPDAAESAEKPALTFKKLRFDL